MPRHCWIGQAILVAIFVSVLAVVSGCSTTAITPISSHPPTAHYQAIAIGEIEATPYTAAFRRSVVQRLKESNAFVQILDPSPKPLPGSTVELTGKLGYDIGGSVIGYCCLPAYAAGHFYLKDEKGTVFGEFIARRDTNYGLYNDAKMTGLFRGLGDAVADAVARWVRGNGFGA